MLHHGSWQSDIFQDSFEERLVQICLALAKYIDVRRNCRGPFQPRDQTRGFAALEALVDSLEQAWLTWTLCIEIHERANDEGL